MREADHESESVQPLDFSAFPSRHGAATKAEGMPVGTRPSFTGHDRHAQQLPALSVHQLEKCRAFQGVTTPLLERYKAQLNPSICLRETLGRPAMQQLTQT